MKKIVVFAVVAVAAIAASVVMADTAIGKAQSIFSAVTVNPEGTYTGTCYNVNMNGKSVPDATGVQFYVVSTGVTNQYQFEGTVYIEVTDTVGGVPVVVQHWIRFNNMTFTVDSTTGAITGYNGGGQIYVVVGGIPVGTFDFNTTTFTGGFTELGSKKQLYFHFEAEIPDFYNFKAKFDYTGTT
jgi:hypothetical protein